MVGDQVVRCGVRDVNGYQIPRADRVHSVRDERVEMHQAVVRGTAGQP